MTNLQNSVDASQADTPTIPWSQTLSWSIRRELWENRSIYIAPLTAAVLMVVGFLFSLRHFARPLRDADYDPHEQMVALASPFSHATWAVMLTALVVGLVYSLGALHNERGDRSILFWKSLPVADIITVMAKASIPLLILPAIVVVLTFVVQFILFLLGSAALAAAGSGAGTLWSRLPWLQLELAFLYELMVLALWIAPIYAWFLLVSGWARRTVFLWAVLPPVALCVLERIAFGTTFVCSLLKDRLIGFFFRAFDLTLPDGSQSDPHLILWSQTTPGRFLATPNLWIGLLVAAALLLAAARQRRFREPI